MRRKEEGGKGCRMVGQGKARKEMNGLLKVRNRKKAEESEKGERKKGEKKEGEGLL